MNNALTKTLTAGLMHGLKINYDCHPLSTIKGFNQVIKGVICDSVILENGDRIHFSYIKPYLFPMSVLTRDEFNHIWQNEIDSESLEQWLSLDMESMLSTKFSNHFWESLHEHHFNVFGLPPEEFIEVNETNNPYKV